MSCSDFTAGVIAEEEEVVTGTLPTVKADAYVRGDMIPMTTTAPGKKPSSVLIQFINIHLQKRFCMFTLQIDLLP